METKFTPIFSAAVTALLVGANRALDNRVVESNDLVFTSVDKALGELTPEQREAVKPRVEYLRESFDALWISRQDNDYAQEELGQYDDDPEDSEEREQAEYVCNSREQELEQAKQDMNDAINDLNEYMENSDSDE